MLPPLSFFKLQPLRFLLSLGVGTGRALIKGLQGCLAELWFLPMTVVSSAEPAVNTQSSREEEVISERFLLAPTSFSDCAELSHTLLI